jgi:CheY-like chemotaxis protein
MIKILIVDDIEENIELLKRHIKRLENTMDEDFSIESCRNGKRAVDYVVNHDVDLIFMDVMMPIMGGIDATKHIKILNPNCMVIAVSSNSDQKSQTAMLKNDAEDYVTKPIDLSLFTSRFKNYIKILATRGTLTYNILAKNSFSSRIYSYNSNPQLNRILTN